MYFLICDFLKKKVLTTLEGRIKLCCSDRTSIIKCMLVIYSRDQMKSAKNVELRLEIDYFLSLYLQWMIAIKGKCSIVLDFKASDFKTFRPIHLKLLKNILKLLTFTTSSSPPCWTVAPIIVKGVTMSTYFITFPILVMIYTPKTRITMSVLCSTPTALCAS